MNAYDLFCLFNSLKLHFKSDSYNFFLYGGKTRSSVDSFQKRKDKYLFHRLARLYEYDDMVNYIAVNFAHSDDIWVNDLLKLDAKKTFDDWKRRMDSMENVYKNDIIGITKSSDDFNELFKTKQAQYPKLLSAFLQKDVSLETMVILDSVVGYLKIWDKYISDDIIYPKISRKISKYGCFLKFDASVYRSITKNLYT